MRQEIRFRRRGIRAADPVVPVQFFPHVAAGVDRQPERQLVTAILEDAIQAYLDERPPGPRGRRKAVVAAEEWFGSEDTSSPFAFLNVCDVLGLDASAVRSALARGRARTSRFAAAFNRERRTCRSPARGRRGQGPIRAPPS